MRARAAGPAFAAAGLLAACADLPPITPEVCGNGIVDEGEQCDSFADPDLGAGPLRCGPAGGIHACTYVCEADGDPLCPSGWACAADGRCRHASGTYDEASGSPRPFVANGLALGDVDGDGSLDLIGHRVTGLSVAFGSPGGELRGDISRSTDVQVGIPAFGNVDPDPTTDMVIPAVSGLIGLRGQSDRTLAPIVYSSVAFDDAPRFVPVNFAESPIQLLVFREGDMQLYDEDNGVTVATRALPDGHLAYDVTDAPLLDLDASGEPELFLGLMGADRIWVYTINPSSIAPVGELPLPGLLNAGPRLGDFNGDGYLDAMVAIQEAVELPAGPCYDPMGGPPMSTWERVAIAWGNPITGVDSFVVDPLFDTMLPSCCGGRSWPAAIGHLDGDSLFDVVGEWAACVQNAAGVFEPRFFGVSFGWQQAGVADFNRDGLADVAALDYQGLDILLGNGTGLFSRYRTDFDSGATVLKIGDFDGDFFSDAAVGVGSRVELFFGSVQGGPAGPVTVAPRRSGQVNAVELAVLDADLTSDLVVSTVETGDGMLPPGGEPPLVGSSSLAFLRGSTQRSMLSPFELNTGNGAEIPDYAFLGRFDASGDLNKDVAVFTHDNNATELHAWLLRGDAQGTLSPAQALVTDLPMTLPPQCMIWRSSDLDADPATPDVLVGITAGDTGLDFCSGPRDGESELYVATLDDASGELVFTTQMSVLSGYLRGPTLIDLADMNGDGLPDLIVTFSWSVDEGGMGPGAAVYYNTGGTIDAAAPALVNRFFDKDGNTLAVQPAHALPINADGDPEKELAILASGFVESDFSYVAGVFIADPDDAGDLPAEARASIQVASFGATRLLVGDVSGDGLDDVLFSTGADVHVYTARASAP